MKSEIWIRIKGPEIHYLNRVLEGHEYLGILTTLDAKEGIGRIRTTEYVYQDIIAVLENLPFKVVYGLSRDKI